jgi:hypothetical protein
MPGNVGLGVLCQMEGLVTVPFRHPTSDYDLTMSREVRWIPEHPYHLLQAPKPDLQDIEFAFARERVASYYLRCGDIQLTARLQRYPYGVARFSLFIMDGWSSCLGD